MSDPLIPLLETPSSNLRVPALEDLTLSSMQQGVRTFEVPACYLTGGRGAHRALPLGGVRPSEAMTVEDFVASHLQARGWSVMRCEGPPLGHLFAGLLFDWLLNPADPSMRDADRGHYIRDNVSGYSVRVPADIGTAAFARRHPASLNTHLDRLPSSTEDLVVDFRRDAVRTRVLRSYLAGGDPWLDYTDSVEFLIRAVGPRCVRAVVKYLAEDYWERRAGWPDLLAWSENSPSPHLAVFVEVKSPRDRMSRQQQVVTEAIAKDLAIPLRIAKVTAAETIDLDREATPRMPRRTIWRPTY